MKFLAGVVTGVVGTTAALVVLTMKTLWDQQVAMYGEDQARLRLTRALNDPQTAIRYITEAQYHYNSQRAEKAEEELRTKGYQA